MSIALCRKQAKSVPQNVRLRLWRVEPCLGEFLKRGALLTPARVSPVYASRAAVALFHAGRLIGYVPDCCTSNFVKALAPLCPYRVLCTVRTFNDRRFCLVNVRYYTCLPRSNQLNFICPAVPKKLMRTKSTDQKLAIKW